MGQFKPVAVKVGEEGLAIWDLADQADQAAGVVQAVMGADAQAVMAADADLVETAAGVVVTVKVEMAAVVAVTVDATVEAVVTEVVDLEWEEAACPDKVKVVLRNQKRKSGMPVYLIR